MSDRDSAKSSATVSTVTFIGAGVAVAAGAILWFTAPRSARTTQGWLTIAPSVGPGAAGVFVTGAF